MDIEEFLQKEEFAYGLANHPYLANYWKDPNILERMAGELKRLGIQNILEQNPRPDYKALYPSYMDKGKMLMPARTRENMESYLELGHLSGALGDELEISLVDACSGNGVLGAMIVGVRSSIGRATNCRCVDDDNGFERIVERTADKLGLQSAQLRGIEADIDKAGLRISSKPTYLVGLKTCEGTHPITRRFIEDDGVELPDHMCIRPCCHHKISNPELITLTNGLSKELASNVGCYKDMVQREDDWIQHERLGIEVKSVSFQILRRIIDCLRAAQIAKTGKFNTRVLEVPVEEFGKKSSHTLVIADKI